jgi:hypothetical protein
VMINIKWTVFQWFTWWEQVQTMHHGGKKPMDRYVYKLPDEYDNLSL